MNQEMIVYNVTLVVWLVMDQMMMIVYLVIITSRKVLVSIPVVQIIIFLQKIVFLVMLNV